jgi:hypothetical protein
MTLALIIICLLVLLVIIDGTESSGAGHGSEVADPMAPAEEPDRSGPGGPCILAVTPIRGRDPQEPRRQAWKPARQSQVETTPR